MENKSTLGTLDYCPFCGRNDTLTVAWPGDNPSGESWVRCECGCSSGFANSQEGAVKIWNTRASVSSEITGNYIYAMQKVLIDAGYDTPTVVCLVDKLCMALKPYLKRESGWVKTKDRLPEPLKHVIGFYHDNEGKDGGWTMTMTMVDYQGNWTSQAPLRWHPMPETPTE